MLRLYMCVDEGWILENLQEADVSVLLQEIQTAFSLVEVEMWRLL